MATGYGSGPVITGEGLFFLKRGEERLTASLEATIRIFQNWDGKLPTFKNEGQNPGPVGIGISELRFRLESGSQTGLGKQCRPEGRGWNHDSVPKRIQPGFKDAERPRRVPDLEIGIGISCSNTIGDTLHRCQYMQCAAQSPKEPLSEIAISHSNTDCVVFLRMSPAKAIRSPFKTRALQKGGR